MNNDKKLWQRKTLSEMSREEWESLCDGCGRCCLEKIEYEDSREVFYTAAACEFLDIHNCRCTAYQDRKSRIPECIELNHISVKEYYWLPKTCAYRLLSEGKDLCDWHPLVSGSSESVHEAGISVRYTAISPEYIDRNNLEAYII